MIITRTTIKSTMQAYAERAEATDEKLYALEYRQEAVTAHLTAAENDLTIPDEAVEVLYELNDSLAASHRKLEHRLDGLRKAMRKLEELDRILEELGY